MTKQELIQQIFEKKTFLCVGLETHLNKKKKNTDIYLLK